MKLPDLYSRPCPHQPTQEETHEIRGRNILLQVRCIASRAHCGYDPVTGQDWWLSWCPDSPVAIKARGKQRQKRSLTDELTGR